MPPLVIARKRQDARKPPIWVKRQHLALDPSLSGGGCYGLAQQVGHLFTQCHTLFECGFAHEHKAQQLIIATKCFDHVAVFGVYDLGM